MDVRVSSRITVTVQIEPGAWIVRNDRGNEVAVVAVEFTFVDGNPRGLVPSTVRRNKGGEWGRGSAGYYFISKFADVPAQFRRDALGAFHAHLQTINTTAETYWENTPR